MPKRDFLKTGLVYHIFNRSIAGYKIFNKQADYERFIELMRFYSVNWRTKFSIFLREIEEGAQNEIKSLYESQRHQVQLIAFCLMPTHFHFVIRQNQDGALSKFMHKLQSSYSHYFNLCHKRQGPLWSGRFKHVECKTDEQLLHLTRYVHLNPVTANLVENPSDWFATSYREYIEEKDAPICEFKNYIPLTGSDYEKFTCNHIENQRELALIKKIMLD